MAIRTSVAKSEQPQNIFPKSNTFWQVVNYFGKKIVALFAMVFVSVLLIILISNYGGYIDKMVAGEIDYQVGLISLGSFTDLPQEEREAKIEELRQQMYEDAGLNEPFLSRTLRWLWMAIRLDFGSPMEGSPFFPMVYSEITIAQMLMASLPATLSLFGISNLVIFFSSVALGLFSSQRFESRVDKFVKKASPLSAIPAWFYGIILSFLLYWLNLNIPIWLLLFIALFLGGFFQSAYAWRSFFVLYSSEEYVEFAKAQGISRGKFEWLHLIRPALPTMMTNFSMSMVTFWIGSIILEPIFNWPGIGNLFFRSTFNHDTSILVSVVVTYAYILAITIFLLEIAYYLVDPRLRIRTGNTKLHEITRRRDFSLVRGKPWKRKLPVESEADIIQKRKFNGVQWIVQNLLALRSGLSRFFANLKVLTRNKGIRRNLIILSLIFGAAILVVVTIPYKEAIRQWRGAGRTFLYQPRDAFPKLVNWFSDEKLPENIVMNTALGEGNKIEEVTPKGNKDIFIEFTFDYPYDGLPQDIILYFDNTFTKQPLFILYWLTPNGEKVKLADFNAMENPSYNITLSDEVMDRLDSEDVNKTLFMRGDDPEKILKGTYTLLIESYLFESDANVDVEMVMRGQVYGLFGTDNLRRDIRIELLWGLPIVLAFGILGAVMTNILSMVIAAIGAWFGGWVDNLIQRITEVNMALPAFPISLLIFVMYSKSIWVILIVTVLLSIFGPGIKSYRSTFLEIRESPYIEAALAYGANDWRLIFRYMVPKISSILIPRIVVALPSFVFLEASLAYLGVSDPVFPTWGKLILETVFLRRGTSYTLSPENMLYYSHVYLSFLIPIGVLILLAVSSNALASHLEKYLNPKLRDS